MPSTRSPFAKKQHYIPQFYLKKFSQDGEYVYIYDKKVGEKGEIRYQTTIQVAHENHFYTYRTKKGTKENLEDLLGQFEGDASAIIERVHQERKITPEEKEKLAIFISFLYTRVPAFKHRTEEMHTKVGEKVARMMARMTPKEKLKKFYREKEGRDPTDAEVDDIIDFAINPKRSKIRFKYPNGYWIKIMLKMAMEIAPAFFGMDWLFLFTDQPYAFITSDNPFLLIPPEDYDRFWGVGLITPRARKVIPLRSDMCLMMGDLSENPVVRFTDTNKEFFRSINVHTVLGSEKFCFSPDKGKLEKLVKELKPYNIPKVERIRVD